MAGLPAPTTLASKNLTPLVQQRLDSADVHSADQGNRVGSIIARSGRADLKARAAQVRHQGVGVPGDDLYVMMISGSDNLQFAPLKLASHTHPLGDR
jgi:hypothetical protein